MCFIWPSHWTVITTQNNTNWLLFICLAFLFHIRRTMKRRLPAGLPFRRFRFDTVCVEFLSEKKVTAICFPPTCLGSAVSSITQCSTLSLKARLHGSPRLINAVESTKVNSVNSSFQRKWSTGLTGEQFGDGQLSFSVVDSLWVTHHRLPVCVLFLCVWFYFW